jgi:hypothetical protein
VEDLVGVRQDSDILERAVIATGYAEGTYFSHGGDSHRRESGSHLTVVFELPVEAVVDLSATVEGETGEWDWRYDFALTMTLRNFCPDLDGDRDIGTEDLLAVLTAWGATCGEICPPEDVDGDGVVGVGDLLFILASWGPCAPASTPTTSRTLRSYPGRSYVVLMDAGGGRPFDVSIDSAGRLEHDDSIVLPEGRYWLFASADASLRPDP